MSHNISRVLLPPIKVTSTSSSSIDAVCSNLVNIHVKIVETEISNHYQQLCTLNISAFKKRPLSSTRWHPINRNIANLKQYFSYASWGYVVESNNLEEAFNRFSKLVLTASDVRSLLEKITQKPKHEQQTFLQWRSSYSKIDVLEADMSYRRV